MHTYDVEGHSSKLRMPSNLPPHSDRARTLKTQVPIYVLQLGFAATQERCWAALHGVGCLGV